MKAVILAGGFGTRISEETQLKPKPMVEIGGKPILWHIMKIYSSYGINEFVICLGYKGYMIKEYFVHYHLHQSDVTFDLRENKMDIHNSFCEPWRVTLVETGPNTMTGGRLKRVKSYVENETFCFTYGDGVSNVDIGELIAFHRREGKKATLTAIQPPSRFGSLDITNHKITQFSEKPPGEGGWINGGFFVLEPGVFDYIEGDATHWENEPIETLAEEGELCAFKHNKFWQSMDTMRDRSLLEKYWSSGKAPWKVW